MQKIEDQTIEYVSILAQLELSEQEKAEAKEDMTRMLHYVDMLEEVDTDGVEPLTHLFPVANVFRDDVVSRTEDRARMLKNAPAEKDGAFQVPKTVE